MALFIETVPESEMPASKAGGCCMARAIAIVTGWDQDTIWQRLAEANAKTKPYQIVGLHSSAMPHAGKRNLDGGTILGPPFFKLMRDWGFRHSSLTDVLYVVDCDAPAFQTGRIVLACQDHAFAMVGGVIHDAFDPQTLTSYKRFGIYHYWRLWA